MPEKSLSLFPFGDGELIISPNKVARIWFNFTSVEFERHYGFFKRDNPQFPKWPIKETKKYNNVTKASLDRLHKVVSKWINDGQATINLFQMMNGAGYEVEF